MGEQLLHHVIVHTGQNYDYQLNQIFFDDLGIRKPDYFLEAAKDGPMETIASILTKADDVFVKEKPDAVLIYGDTNSGLCVIPAKRRKIPVFHLEAGNRCFDQRVPEELNRKVIDHLSDINMVLTDHARRYLLAEGLPGDRIFNVGSHMAEVLDHFQAKIQSSTALARIGVEKDGYFIVSVHREENVDPPGKLRAFLSALDALVEGFEKPVIVSTHPRTSKRIAAQDGKPLSPLIRFMTPFGFTDYIKLQLEAYCVISDSGTITEEAALLDFPAVTVRDIHERPEGVDAGVLIRSSFDSEELRIAICMARTGVGKRRASGRVRDYEVEDVSSKVARVVASYIDVVNRLVWSRETGTNQSDGRC